MDNMRAKLYVGILFLPVIGFIIPNDTINSYAYFLVVIALIVLAYCSYAWKPVSDMLEFIRNCTGCLSTALLILLLSAQVTYIMT